MSLPRHAVVVAAGLSSRLRPLTARRPKCLLEVGGRSMLERSLAALRARGVEDVVVVVGFEHQQVRDQLGAGARCVENPFYATTNNMASLWMARAAVEGRDFVYLHADLVYDERLLDALGGPGGADVELLVDGSHVDPEAMKVRLVDGRFESSSKQIPLDQAAGEWTGITRFTAAGGAAFFRHAGDLLMEGALDVYDTAAFNRMAAAGVGFSIRSTGGLPWREVDTLEDLEAARELFPGAETP